MDAEKRDVCMSQSVSPKIYVTYRVRNGKKPGGHLLGQAIKVPVVTHINIRLMIH